MDRTVAVTGGSGKLGRAVVAALIEQGWTVVNLDRVPSQDTRARFVHTDLTDYGQVVEAFSGIDIAHVGVDAVVHLAAIPGAGGFPNVTIFENNVLSTFHVFQAARLLKIRNVIWASSETLLGYPFEHSPAYVPLDEEVPATPEVVYALAKDLEERMALHYCRWDPELKMIGLRFSNVIDTNEYGTFPVLRRRSGLAEMESLVLHRRPRRRPGRRPGPRLPDARIRQVRDRQHRQRDDASNLRGPDG